MPSPTPYDFLFPQNNSSLWCRFGPCLHAAQQMDASNPLCLYVVHYLFLYTILHIWLMHDDIVSILLASFAWILSYRQLLLGLLLQVDLIKLVSISIHMCAHLFIDKMCFFRFKWNWMSTVCRLAANQWYMMVCHMIWSKVRVIRSSKLEILPLSKPISAIYNMGAGKQLLRPHCWKFLGRY